MDKLKIIHGFLLYMVKSWCLMSGIVLFLCALKVLIGESYYGCLYFCLMIFSTSIIIHLLYELPYGFKTLRKDTENMAYLLVGEEVFSIIDKWFPVAKEKPRHGGGCCG